jgi:hypothetical protein
MEVTQKNVSLIVGASKKLPDIAIILGFFFKAHQPCIDALRCNTTPPSVCDGAESACIAWALFELVQEKLVGTPLEISKTRVSAVRCNALNGKTVLSWNTQGSLSMMRKTIGVVLSCLTPHKLYSRYAENCRLIGCKIDRSVFNKLANDMSASITKSVKIAVCGKIKITAPKLKDLLSKVMTKMPKQTLVKSTSSTPKHADCKNEWPLVKSSGIEAVLVADYISAKSGGMSVRVVDGGVIVYNQTWATKGKALGKAKRIGDYTRQKYEKLKGEFAPILAYMAITRNFAECCTVTKIIKSKTTPAAATTMLKKAL